jgi:hypothetical protein
MTIHPLNNDCDLEAIEVATPGPFAIGDTLPGRASYVTRAANRSLVLRSRL